MKSIFIWLPILIACSCNFQQKHSASGHTDALNDTLAYEELLAAFDARYAEIEKAYDQYHSYGFDVMGVSTDVRKEQWLEAIEKDGLIWTNLCALQKWNENTLVKTYALRQVSQNFLLDSSGKIIATNLRGEDLVKTLEELLD